MSFDNLSACQPAGWEWLDDERRALDEQTAQDWEVMLLTERPAISDDALVSIITDMDNYLRDMKDRPSRQKLRRNAEHLTQVAVSPWQPASLDKNFWE